MKNWGDGCFEPGHRWFNRAAHFISPAKRITGSGRATGRVKARHWVVDDEGVPQLNCRQV